MIGCGFLAVAMAAGPAIVEESRGGEVPLGIQTEEFSGETIMT